MNIVRHGKLDFKKKQKKAQQYSSQKPSTLDHHDPKHHYTSIKNSKHDHISIILKSKLVFQITMFVYFHLKTNINATICGER